MQEQIAFKNFKNYFLTSAITQFATVTTSLLKMVKSSS